MPRPLRQPARTLGLGLALLASSIATACDQPDHDDAAPRLAVVLVGADRLEESMGSYDVETGELTFAPQVQDELREVLGDAGYGAIVAHDGEDADVDLDEGVAVTTAELEEGDVLELRATRADVGTSRIGRLELRGESESEFRSIWKDGNITGMDDWEKHNT